MFEKITLSRYMRLLGSLAVFISLSTWWLDLADIISTCPFCRTERTVIGLLGVLMIAPSVRYITVFLAILFAAVGLSVASHHLFIMIKSMQLTVNTPFVVGALCIISGELLVLLERVWIAERRV